MNLQTDSRKVQKGDIFFCIKGITQDGHDFASDAAARGAAVIVYSHDIPFAEQEGTAYIKVDDTLKALNEAADSYNGFPSKHLTMFGVTGTNGKTTIAYMLSNFYAKLRGSCGYIGTIGSHLATKDETIMVSDVDLTTPDSISMHNTLGRMLKDGAIAAAIEVSAHGLAQGRVDSIDFDYAIYTNLTQEHLDYFGDMESYFQGKTLFFKMLKPEATAIINTDDEYSQRVLDVAKASPCKNVLTYGINNDADYRAVDIEYTQAGMKFVLEHDGERTPFSTSLHVTYNLYNLLAVIATLHQAGIPMEELVALASNAPTVPGRMNEINNGQDFKVIVDFAHTSDSYAQLLKYVKEDLPDTNRVITINGAAGKRDKRNREEFAKWIGRYGDFAIFTEDDPRDEAIEDIAKEIASHLPEGFPYEIITDRYEAIKYAVDNATTNDVILILGKGVETYQARANGKEFWMGDDNAARQALNEK